MGMKLSESMEDYLEAIATACENGGIARVKEIRALMNVKTPSVTGAMRQLAKLGLINHEKYGYITLTEKGAGLAQGVKKRHALLCLFLEEVLGVDKETAEMDACRIEHALSDKTFKELARFVEETIRIKKKKNTKKNKLR